MATLSKIISIVDDEEDIVCLFKDALKGLDGFSVVTFTDPNSALQHYKENKSNYTLVLSDYKMPCMSGIELIKQIKETNQKVRTLLMTAFEVDNKLIEEYTSKKILDGHLQKPVRITELRQEVGNQLHDSEI